LVNNRGGAKLDAVHNKGYTALPAH
jgi:hypothetical protein